MPAGTRHALSLELPGLPLRDHEPVVRAAEASGYTDAWSGETGGHDGFTALALAGAWSERMRLGTGVVNVFTRGPAVLAQHAAALQDSSGGRFCLGIGSSSNVIVERWNGISFARPRTRVRDTIAFLRAALAGERASPPELGPQGAGPSPEAGGFKLEQPPSAPVPIVVAALRERMLRTAGELGDGAFLNFLPLASAARVVEEVRAGERAAGKGPGSCEVLCRLFCIQGDPDEALPVASWMFAAYASVPVYEAFFGWLGHGEAIAGMVEAWRARDRDRALRLVPRELVEDVFVLGDARAQRERIDAFRARGVATPVLLPIAPGAAGAGAADAYGPLVESLAPG